MRLAAALMIGLAVLSAPVAAADAPEEKAVRQSVTGSRIMRTIPKRYYDAAKTMKIYEAFNRCVVDRRRDKVLAILTAPNESPEQYRAINAMIPQEDICLRDASRMRFNAVLLRGGVAEVLYEENNPSRPSAEKDVAGQGGDYDWTLDTPKGGLDLLMAMTACYAAARPGEIHDLLLTTPASDAEAVLLEKMADRFGSCLPAGTKLSMNPLMLRAALAEGLYRASKQEALL